MLHSEHPVYPNTQLAKESQMSSPVNPPLSYLKTIADLEAQIEKLWRFVHAADAIQNPMYLGDKWMVKEKWHKAMDEYEAARRALGNER